MKLWLKAALVIGLAASITVLYTSTALAAMRIYENKGVGRARLGWKDTRNKAYLGHLTTHYTDKAYKTPTYCWAFGKRLGYHRYALQMFSNRYHTVFEFACNTSFYVTAKGVRVGSKLAFLKAKYGKTLHRYAAGLYWRYTYGHRPYTDFYVKKSTGRVFEIIVRSR